MSRLLTGEQAREIAQSRSAEIASDIYLRTPLAMAKGVQAEALFGLVLGDLIEATPTWLRGLERVGLGASVRVRMETA
jgi:hypothetical protein